ncbi:MAG TPA: chemotaxis protein CheW [Candidatus Rifleibacterium sp.]|nr:chemotaxis protein CheW [Candidatus Rifleibacterium sp.]
MSEQSKLKPADDSSAILRARAAVLAREPEQTRFKSDGFNTVVFALGGETYAFASEFVREVYPLKDYTVVPGLPAFILGIVNVRGQIVSVVDLRKFFGLPEKGLGELNKVIVLRNDRMEFGIMADLILGSRKIYDDELQSSLLTISGLRADFLRGVTTDSLIVLDADRILNDPGMLIHEEFNARPD